jgi:hypothetical protein
MTAQGEILRLKHNHHRGLGLTKHIHKGKQRLLYKHTIAATQACNHTIDSNPHTAIYRPYSILGTITGPYFIGGLYPPSFCTM